MNLNYSKKGVTFLLFLTYTMSYDTVVATYQRILGDIPNLDFIVKYKKQSKRLKTPYPLDYRAIKKYNV